MYGGVSVEKERSSPAGEDEGELNESVEARDIFRSSFARQRVYSSVTRSWTYLWGRSRGSHYAELEERDTSLGHAPVAPLATDDELHAAFINMGRLL